MAVVEDIRGVPHLEGRSRLILREVGSGHLLQLEESRVVGAPVAVACRRMSWLIQLDPPTLSQCKIICFARWLPIVQKCDEAYCLPKGVGSQLGVLLYCHSDTLVEQLEEGKAAVVTWGRWAGTSPL